MKYRNDTKKRMLTDAVFLFLTGAFIGWVYEVVLQLFQSDDQTVSPDSGEDSGAACSRFAHCIFCGFTDVAALPQYGLRHYKLLR